MMQMLLPFLIIVSFPLFLYAVLYLFYWIGVLVQIICGDRDAIHSFDCENKQSFLDDWILGPPPPPPPWKKP